MCRVLASWLVLCSAVNCRLAASIVLPSKSTPCAKREHTLTGHSNSEVAADDNNDRSPYIQELEQVTGRLQCCYVVMLLSNEIH